MAAVYDYGASGSFCALLIDFKQCICKKLFFVESETSMYDS
jgi:hypothetical protein